MDSCPTITVVAKPFTVRHTGSELKELAYSLKSLDGETRVIMEHTGRYYEPAAQFLHDSGLYIRSVNPKLIKDYGNNSLRKVKMGKADSRKIAKYGLDNWVDLLQYPVVLSRWLFHDNRSRPPPFQNRNIPSTQLIFPAPCLGTAPVQADSVSSHPARSILPVPNRPLFQWDSI